MRYRKKLRYRMRYRMRYRIGTRRWQLKICDIVYDIAYDIDLDAISHAISYDLSHGISQWCDIEWIFFAISCTIFSPVPALCACSVCRCGHWHVLLLPCCLHRGTAGWWSWCLAARIGSSWNARNGYNARLLPCSWRKWNVTARPACLICRLGPVIRADAAVTQQYGFDAGAWQQPWCWFKFKFRLSTRMSCPSNCHGTGTSKVVSWRSWPDTRFGCCGSPDRILPTYVCMQGSALVVWPGMPFP